MSYALHLVIYSAVLTWLMLYAAAILRTRAWSPIGLKIAFGNRDNVPPVSPLAFRADQTAQNTLEGFILFAPLVITAHIAGLSNAQTELGAAVFFLGACGVHSHLFNRDCLSAHRNLAREYCGLGNDRLAHALIGRVHIYLTRRTRCISAPIYSA